MIAVQNDQALNLLFNSVILFNLMSEIDGLNITNRTIVQYRA